MKVNLVLVAGAVGALLTLRCTPAEQQIVAADIARAKTAVDNYCDRREQLMTWAGHSTSLANVPASTPCTHFDCGEAGAAP